MMHDPLVLYDFTRERLRAAVEGRLPDGVDAEAFCADIAYWICLAVTVRSQDWHAAFSEFTDAAMLAWAAEDAESERRELDLIRRELARARGPVLDVGAGWGRMAALYAQAGLTAYYAEPAALGARLMRRAGISAAVGARGEALPFPAGVFQTTVIGWVLHHDAGDVDAARLLREAARVTEPGGLLLSVEPLDERFGQTKWLSLLAAAGFAARRVETFYERAKSRGDVSRHTLFTGVRLP
ncbi:MAG: class I SAM-dependent methyltransferase [Anaerolineae bacterium]|nr:class I SAM-dependent methyltransferase [Anaerolineae bacterium]